MQFMAGFFSGAVLTAILSGLMAYDTGDRLKRQAIERGYALYCPTTGDFTWKGECDE